MVPYLQPPKSDTVCQTDSNQGYGYRPVVPVCYRLVLRHCWSIRVVLVRYRSVPLPTAVGIRHSCSFLHDRPWPTTGNSHWCTTDGGWSRVSDSGWLVGRRSVGGPDCLPWTAVPYQKATLRADEKLDHYWGLPLVAGLDRYPSWFSDSAILRAHVNDPPISPAPARRGSDQTWLPRRGGHLPDSAAHRTPWSVRTVQEPAWCTLDMCSCRRLPEGYTAT